MKLQITSASAIWAGLLALPLNGQTPAIDGFLIDSQKNPILSFSDLLGSNNNFYEIMKSPDLKNWTFMNYALQNGSQTDVFLPKGNANQEFYAIRRVITTVNGEGVTGASSALSDASFLDDGQYEEKVVELGRLLFWDKLLSGNRAISCATCHHTFTGTGDGLSLSIGEGGSGLGILRTTGADAAAVHERVPRNAPPIFSIGAKDFDVMFHDGRVTVDSTQPSGFFTPAGDDLPSGLVNVLAAQAMFPVTSGTEMAGQSGENEIADFAAAGNLPGLWNALAVRLQGVPEYVTLFSEAFDDIDSADDITYVHAANAIGIYEAAAFRSDNSPFDHFMKGDSAAMSDEALSGMNLFYGAARCAQCHSGNLQTDFDFHAIAMPQIGPGKGDGVDGREDFGRFRVTQDPADKFAFRTPTLRNVALTAPYGHAGAYRTLEGVVRHHLDPVNSLNNYDPSQLRLPSRADLDALDLVVQNDSALRGAIAAANELEPVTLTDTEVSQVISFLHSLTDPASLDLTDETPVTVPSGLPVDD